MPRQGGTSQRNDCANSRTVCVLVSVPKQGRTSQRNDCANSGPVCILVSVPRQGGTSQRNADGRCTIAVDVTSREGLSEASTDVAEILDYVPSRKCLSDCEEQGMSQRA